jgi:methylphosphotriester-DNA--protein-cysteine methyltransferase
VNLRSVDQARHAGFRACRVCRPVDPPFRTAVA